MTRSECLATNVEGSFHRKHSTNERYFDLFTSEAVKARVSRPILGIFLYTNLFYTKKFAFFTPKILHFLHQKFCIFTPKNFSFLHQKFHFLHQKICIFYTKIFALFLHQFFYTKSLTFLQQKFCFFTPIFYTKFSYTKSFAFLHQFFYTKFSYTKF